VGRLVAGRERKLGDLEGAAMEFLRGNVVAFQVWAFWGFTFLFVYLDTYVCCLSHSDEVEPVWAVPVFFDVGSG
jgi:hypothetical protein